MTPTGLVHHPGCLDHLTGPGHPERPERLAAVHRRLESSGLAAELDLLEASPAAPEWIAGVHGGDHVRFVEERAAEGFGLLDAGDTAISSGSYGAARLAAGAALDAVDRVLAGEWANAFALVRPPGHHAERARSMGFCLFNNVAIAARYLQRHHGLERIAILDWDVHHGNGTQHLFESDPSVFFASLHQWPRYPGTGAERERGIGAGEGATLNRPMDAGTGDAEWLAALEREVLPALESFAPQALLVSAGFDAHRADPLSGTRLTEEGFRGMSALALEAAARTCGGRLISVLEGGYDLEALASSVEAHLGELLTAARADPR